MGGKYGNKRNQFIVHVPNHMVLAHIMLKDVDGNAYFQSASIVPLSVFRLADGTEVSEMEWTFGQTMRLFMAKIG